MFKFSDIEMSKELEVQKFLRLNLIDKITEQYGIKVRQSKIYPNLYCFKYSQIDSPMSEPIVRECRGIILDKENNWAVVSRPYDKFFNYGEGHAANIDWSTSKVYKKEDGSLMTLYYYNNEWLVQSSGDPDAGGEILNNTKTFNELFWEVWDELGYRFPLIEERHYCFMFELMTPLNKVVVQHNQNRLVFHGARNLETQLEVPIHMFKEACNWELCKTFSLNTIDQIINSSKKLNPINQEGYIIVDSYYNRVKVKSPAYVALHHTKDSMSPKHLLEIIQIGEGEEILSYLPEFTDLYNSLKMEYDNLCSQILDSYNNLVLPYQSDYRTIGLNTKHLFYQGCLFNMLRNNKTVKQVLKKMSTQKLERYLKQLCL